MKKILILTPFGRTDEPEEVKLMHLYFASLKKHVVPHYDVKVVLLNNFKVESSETSQTYQQIKNYGLEDVVILKTIYEMDLPEKAINFITELGPSTSVGAKLNLLFDYAKRSGLVNESDWIFHVDSDMEFQENFYEFLEKVDAFPFGNKVITVSCDTMHTHVRANGNTYMFEQADRVSLYEENTIPRVAHSATVRKVKKVENTQPENSTWAFSPQKTKVRNDFVGLTRWAALELNTNWLIEYYPSYQEILSGTIDCATDVDKELASSWDSLVNNLQLNLTEDKGGYLEFILKSGVRSIVRVELPGSGFMVTHYGGGWGNPGSFGRNIFLDAISTRLPEHYFDYRSAWEADLS